MSNSEHPKAESSAKVDMSPQAIAARIEKVSQLRELAQTLKAAKPVQR